MIPRGVLGLCLCLLLCGIGNAITAINTALANKSVVFFFDADATGQALTMRQDATGFLIAVPSRNGRDSNYLLVTARHVVDPVWAGCGPRNPTRIFARVNKMQYNPKTDETGVSYIGIDLVREGMATWLKSEDEDVDVAVLDAPRELLSGNYDIKFVNFRNFGEQDEIAKLGIGSQIATTGLVPGLEGRNRNNPIFKFGKIASIPDETVSVRCRPSSLPRPLRVWLLAANLVPGNSGSPIYFDPLFPPGADISSGEPRAMIIGLQSIGATGELAGMTPARYIIDVISRAVPPDADLTLGLPSK